MSKDLQLFNNKELGQITTRLDGNGEPIFLLKDVCEILELGQVAGVKRRLEDDVISNHPILDSLGRTQQATFINEDGLYDVIFDSRKPQAKAFRKWVTSDVLPTIRKEGAYISANITDEQADKVDKKMLYATPQRRRKAIEQATIDGTGNVFEVYQDILGFMKNWKADDKVTTLKHVEKVLEDKKASYGTDIAFVAKIEQLAVTVAKDIDKIRNHSYGARLREANKQNKVLEQKVEELRPPSLDEYIELNIHPFSYNYMYDKVDGRQFSTPAYLSWQKRFPAFSIPSLKQLGVDKNKPIELSIAFIAKEGYDTDNTVESIVKSLQDRLFGFKYQMDDYNVHLGSVNRIGTCETFDEGKIYIHLRNIEERVAV